MFAVLRFAFTAMVFAVSAGQVFSADAPEKSKPNVIVIISDDHGYHDLGVRGADDIKTPNLDKLAANGILFSQGYVTCPVCSPSRAALMTGRYQQRFGHEFNPGPNGADNFGLPTNQKTLANYMKDAGYKTGAVGKWHLGQRAECMPLKRGFDEYYGFLGGAHSYVPTTGSQMGKNSVYRNNDPIDAPPYLTYAFNDEAVKFIDNHKADPFFLYLAYNAIHTPLQAAPGQAEKFANIKDPQRRTMATMLASLDDGVGRILERLKTHGILENTLILFTGDNGGPTAGNGSRNDPLSGFKGDTLEGGIRVPMIVSWPAKLPKGTTFDKPSITVDFLPTVLAAAGGKPADGAKLDGVNLLPYLSGKDSGSPHESLFWRFGGQFAIRSGDWKLVRTRDQKTKLFNLAKDIGEKQDLATSEAEKAKEMQSTYDKWNASNVAALWHDSRQQRKQEQARPVRAEKRPGGKKARKRAMRTEQAGQYAATTGTLNAEADE